MHFLTIIRRSLIILSGLCALACSNTTSVTQSSEESDDQVYLDHFESHIVGGQSESGWPGVGALTMRVPGYGYVGSFCTGSLITSEWVLTAAHCLVESGDQGIAPSPTNTRFFVGTNANPTASSGEPAGTYYTVDRFVIHPNYDATELSDDIALMHLSEAANTVETYDYNEYNLNQYVGSNAFYVGFGADNGRAMSGGGVKRSTSLAVEQVVQTQYYSQYNGSGTCFGDSGGPGLLNIQGQWRIIGVNSAVSGNIPCEEYYISTRVDTYAPWISSTLGAPPPNCNQIPDICLCDSACQPNGGCDNTDCEVSSCAETYECLIDCEADLSCQSLCYAQSTDNGQRQLDNLLRCFNDRCGALQGESFQQCASQQCAGELESCFPQMSGNLSCSGVSDCVYACPNGDAECQQSCLAQGTEEAQETFINLNTCYNEQCGQFDQADDFYACIESECVALYLGCYPSDNCDVTGGDCSLNEACYVGFSGRTYCYPSDGAMIGSSCEQSTPDTLICEDGSLCFEGLCTPMCLNDADCIGGSCLAPLFDSNEQIGVCSCVDEDSDGVCADQDCNDQDAMISGGQSERCNDQIDNDCDGTIDETCDACVDEDSDGYCALMNDCNDLDPMTHVDSSERCGDGADNDCDNVIDEGCEGCIDADRDGFCANVNDCSDNDPTISPSAEEQCLDGVDNDCDGLIDEVCVSLGEGGSMIDGGNEVAVIGSESNPSCTVRHQPSAFHGLFIWILLFPFYRRRYSLLKNRD